MNAVRTNEKALFMSYCRDLAERRFRQGVPQEEVCRALTLLKQVCMSQLSEEEELAPFERALYDHVTMTFQFGCDQVAELYENLTGEL